jgi:aspartyl aminopeptidase
MENTKNAWLTYSEEEYQTVMSTADAYMNFISTGKTERRCVKQAIELAKGFGYKNINEYVENGLPIKAQDKVYYNMMDKALVLFHVGSDPLEKGMNILGAHIDSPRIDLKQHPIYEQDGICLFDTHYYGGIKKYQWTTIPLALYGVVYLKDGTHVDVAIGDNEEDEVFVITELLVHLSQDLNNKKASEVIAGEDLNVTIGSIPAKGVEKNPVKANILNILKERFGIDEEDFVSAELEVVPAGKARTVGFDRSMILGYGQDDRVCAYTSLIAQLEAGDQDLERTAVCLLVDKEEIGSVGATGMHSRFFENQLAELMHAAGQYSDLALRRALQNSTMLSSDVVAAHDPNYASVSSPNGNMAVFGGGICFAKYTGSRGKSGSNDASAEYIAKLRKVMDDNNVIWQTSELGKVDQGGGGTIAYILAAYGMNVIDCGVALHNMHAPHELSSKADVYEAVKCYKAFIKDMR